MKSPVLIFTILLVPVACGTDRPNASATSEGTGGGGPAAGGSPETGGAPTVNAGGAPASAGGAAIAAAGGGINGGGMANGGTAGMNAGAGGAAGAEVTPPGTGGSVPAPPTTCAEAAAPFAITMTPLAGNIVPAATSDIWGGGSFSNTTRLSVSTASDGRTYVGATVDESSGLATKIAQVASDQVVTIPNAALGSIAATENGVAALLYDPASTDQRVWASVARFDTSGTQVFNTELFHSDSLEPVGSKGAPSRGRLGYIESSDTVVAYFGHTQRYEDGVRHQGGYLANLDAAGTETVLSGWFGSHNLDQRLLVAGDRAAVIGLGDAYPKGFFMAYNEPRARPTVVYLVAAAGNGAAAAKLGALTEFDDVLVASFVTDRSVPPDLDAGEWPNIDPAVSEQVRNAEANGTDLGLLMIPKGAAPAPVEPVWVDLAPAAGARITALKTVRYGAGDLLLIAWAEATGSTFNPQTTTYTLIADRDGAICQPKQAILADQSFLGTDDLVRRPDGTIVWANAQSGTLSLATLTPEQ